MRNYIRTNNYEIYEMIYCDLDYCYCPVRGNPYYKGAKIVNMGDGTFSGLCYAIPIENVKQRTQEIYSLAQVFVWDYRLCWFNDEEFTLSELHCEGDEYNTFPITEDMIEEGIYGAIWTPDGLTYICKMTSDGGRFTRFGNFESCYYECLADLYKERS